MCYGRENECVHVQCRRSRARCFSAGQRQHVKDFLWLWNEVEFLSVIHRPCSCRMSQLRVKYHLPSSRFSGVFQEGKKSLKTSSWNESSKKRVYTTLFIRAIRASLAALTRMRMSGKCVYICSHKLSRASSALKIASFLLLSDTNKLSAQLTVGGSKWNVELRRIRAMQMCKKLFRV